MQKLNATDRGYYAFDWLDVHRKKHLEYVAPRAVARKAAIRGRLEVISMDF
jgi:hypothetical protein